MFLLVLVLIIKDDFINSVGKGYKDIIGYEADFYIASIGYGTRELDVTTVLG